MSDRTRRGDTKGATPLDYRTERAGAREREHDALWLEDAMFQNHLCDVLARMRPHRVERLAGWREYRVRGDGFRVSVAWDPQRNAGSDSRGDRGETRRAPDADLAIPDMVEVLEAILVGSVNNQDSLDPAEEFARYSRVVRELADRLEAMRACYD